MCNAAFLLPTSRTHSAGRCTTHRLGSMRQHICQSFHLLLWHERLRARRGFLLFLTYHHLASKQSVHVPQDRHPSRHLGIAPCVVGLPKQTDVQWRKKWYHFGQAQRVLNRWWPYFVASALQEPPSNSRIHCTVAFLGNVCPLCLQCCKTTIRRSHQHQIRARATILSSLPVGM